MKPARTKKCAVCRYPFQPANSMQKVCGLVCSVEHGRVQLRRQARKAKTEGRRKLMTRRDWIKKAQVAFNSFIRARDAAKPCICCGQPLGDQKMGGSYDAGHYRSTGSAPHLRFHEDNCHAQRKVCNQFGSGRAVDYRIGLIARIGLVNVEALEADQAPRKYTIDDLQAIERRYRQMARELRA